MAGDSSFLVEEFLEAVASQLDRTQDALAFKAVNRPLNYAIKDFSLQLQVFVEMDHDGGVRLRNSGPNEAGASTISIGFTTITRPMIEENTISLAGSRGPSLVEAGFAPAERQQLERLGVRNTSQLRRLGSTTGASAVSRLTQIPVDRLRAALQLGQPEVTAVHSSPPPRDSGRRPEPTGTDKVALAPPVIRLGPETSHVHLFGTSLVNEDGWPEARLDGRPVPLAEVDWDRIVVPVPHHVTSATLEVTLPGGDVSVFQVIRDPHDAVAVAVADGLADPSDQEIG